MMYQQGRFDAKLDSTMTYEEYGRNEEDYESEYDNLENHQVCDTEYTKYQPP